MEFLCDKYTSWNLLPIIATGSEINYEMGELDIAEEEEKEFTMTPNNKAKRLRILPPNDNGIVSPYPTVVTVIIAHHIASGIVLIGSLRKR